MFVCLFYLHGLHTQQSAGEEGFGTTAKYWPWFEEKSTKIPLLLSFKGLKLTVSSVKILACEQTLCLGKGWKNREEPLLAIFSPLRFFHQYEWWKQRDKKEADLLLNMMLLSSCTKTWLERRHQHKCSYDTCRLWTKGDPLVEATVERSETRCGLWF